MREFDRRTFLNLAGMAAASLITGLLPAEKQLASADHASPSTGLPTNLNPTITYDQASSEVVIAKSGGTIIGKNLRKGDIFVAQSQAPSVGGVERNLADQQGSTVVTAVIAENDTYVEEKFGPNTTNWETVETSSSTDFGGMISDAVNAGQVQANRSGTKGNCGLDEGCSTVETIVLGAHRNPDGNTGFDLVMDKTFQR